MTDYTSLERRAVKLREMEFEAKPTMSARDFGILTKFNGKTEIDGDYFEIVSGVIRRTLTPESRERWDKIWDEDMDVPVTWEEILEVANELATKEAARPTLPPSPSGSGAKSTPTSSTDGFASREEAASRISPSVPA